MAVSDSLLPKRYEILRELGSGGTSVVYHARDRENGRDVAVKLLAKERLEDRFAREADRLSRLSHPNVVGFFEVGKHQGRDYLVMEYLPGGDLANFLRGKGSEEILRTFVLICAGLGYLHDHGIVHRDIKPANILIDSHGQPKLTDLGSSRQVDRKTRITKVGSILGTYAYLAPEQIQSQDAGPAADLYALGVCLFEALTGRRPFTVKNEFKLMQSHLEEPPPSLHKFRPELPDSLASLVAALLEKKPEARPTNAAVVAGMLERCITHLGTHAKQQMVDHDPEQAIEGLSEDQRSVLLAIGYLGEKASFVEICGASAFAEDRTDSLLESLVEARLLTCPDNETFALTFPRKLVLSRFTPRVRELFARRMIAAGLDRPSVSGMTTAGMTTTGLDSGGSGVTRTTAMLSLVAPRIGEPIPASPPLGRFVRGKLGLRMIQLGVIVTACLLGGLGWAWSHSGELVVASFPEQASVLVDGEWRGKTPVRIHGLLPGSHTVRVVLDGYITEVRDVNAAMMRPVPMDFTLKESRGRLGLANVPAGAQVTINGAVYDPKDLDELSLLAGKARVKVVKEGYRTYFQEVSVKAGEPSFVKVEMSPIIGQIECTSEPTGATVLLDGKDAGQTPITLKDLSFGSHRVEIVKSGYTPHSQTVTVNDETPDKVHADLVAVWGTVTITSNPEGAEVMANGKMLGRTPLTLSEQPPGTMIVGSRLAGYKQTLDEIEVVPGQAISLDLQLVSGSGVISRLKGEPGGPSPAEPASQVAAPRASGTPSTSITP